MAKKTSEKEMKDRAIDETTLIPVPSETTENPTAVPSVHEDNFAPSVSDDGFETISGIIPFWDFAKEKVMVGTFMGAGNEVGNGDRSTLTWKFKTSDGRNYLVPQWAMLSDLNGVNPNEFIYRITYDGLYERKDGSKFHMVNVERKRKGVVL